MAKRTKQRTETSAKRDLVKLCAFVGILISAVLFVVGSILTWCGLGSIAGVFSLIGQLALLVAVAFPAWDWVKYKSQTWRVVYWVALCIYVFGCIFHVVGIYIG